MFFNSNISGILPLGAATQANKIIETFLFLALFLFGINYLSGALKNVAGSKLKLVIEKATKKPIYGILTGVLITAIVQSSSAVTVIVIGLISAGLITLPQAVAVIIGSNIGTTVTAFIVGLDIFFIAPYLIIVGALVVFFVQRKTIKGLGEVILGFGLLFYGLDNLGTSLKELFVGQPFIEESLIKIGSNSALGILAGFFITFIVQSSSAFIAIVQKLHLEMSDSFTLSVAIPMIMGSNIGTTTTALLSSFGGTRDSKRAALAHMIFNVVGTVAMWILLKPNIYIMGKLEAYVNPAFSLAIFHIIFNTITAAIFYFALNLLVRTVEKIIPMTDQEKMVRQIERLEPNLVKEAPSLALENAHVVIVEMGKIVKQMFEATVGFINNNDVKLYNEVVGFEETVDNYDNRLHEFLTKLNGEVHSAKDRYMQTIFFDTIRDLERIADHSVNLVEFMETRYQLKMEFHPESLEMINHMCRLLTSMIQDSGIAFDTSDKKAASRIRATEPQIDELEKKYRRAELSLISNGEISATDLHFVDILANLERIGDHANNIASNVLFDGNLLLDKSKTQPTPIK